MEVIAVIINTGFYFKQEPSVQSGQAAEGDIHLSCFSREQFTIQLTI